MTRVQELWWLQAKSDYETFELLRGAGSPTCHQLHYLQMASEKFAKAYLWKSGRAPAKSHTGFPEFLRMLAAVPRANQNRLATVMGYNRYVDLANWVKHTIGIASEFERLAPTLSADGENPEYPWPHNNPVSTPVTHRFGVWNTIRSAQGTAFLKQLKFMIENFPQYAHL